MAIGVTKDVKKESTIQVQPPMNGAEVMEISLATAPRFLSFLGADNPNVNKGDVSQLTARHSDTAGVLACIQQRGAMIVNALVGEKYVPLGLIRTAEELRTKIEQFQRKRAA